MFRKKKQTNKRTAPHIGVFVPRQFLAAFSPYSEEIIQGCQGRFEDADHGIGGRVAEAEEAAENRGMIDVCPKSILLPSLKRRSG